MVGGGLEDWGSGGGKVQLKETGFQHVSGNGDRIRQTD